MSDLHLETPTSRPSYDDYEIEPVCACLALLGDIGNVADPRLFAFLERQLQQFELVFFVPGNHEPYGTTMDGSKTALRKFEAEIDHQRNFSPSRGLGKFVFLDRRRFDYSGKVTVLGCTLFSSIRPDQHSSVARFVSDFDDIEDWTVETHRSAHQKDLSWLNAQVSDCASEDPNRSIVIFTHHSPTVAEAANDPRHVRDDAQIQSAFVTDLSKEPCWRCPQVKLWAFGHTHFNCDFADPATGKRIVANQKGYRRQEVMSFDATKTVAVEEDSPNPADSSEDEGRRKACCIVS
ncbi:MAG: hypothetical protein Q9169_007029 [Polycauliona sp. 2 TL-2023]